MTYLAKFGAVPRGRRVAKAVPIPDAVAAGGGTGGPRTPAPPRARRRFWIYMQSKRNTRIHQIAQVDVKETHATTALLTQNATSDFPNQ